jgi:hypothetical protein
MVGKLTVKVVIGLAIVLIASSAMPESGGWLNKRYNVDAFERVYFKGDAALYLVQDPDLYIQQARVGQIAAYGAADKLEQLTFESVDGVLYIDAGSHQAVNELVIYLAVSQLKEVVSEGRGQIFGDGLTLKTLALEGHGAGQFNFQHLRVADLTVIGNGATSFEVSGAAEHQFVDLGGVGRYMARELASQISLVNVREAGQVDIWVKKVLDVNVLGSARVRYSGKPWVLQQIYDTGAVDHLLKTSS